VTSRQAQNGAANEDTARERAIKTLITDRLSAVLFITVNTTAFKKCVQAKCFLINFYTCIFVTLWFKLAFDAC